MDNFVIFTTQEWGYDRDEVAAYIAQLHQEYEEMAANYEARQKEQVFLKIQSDEQS